MKMYRPRCGLQDAQSVKKRRLAAPYSKLSVAFKRKGMHSSKCSPERLALLIAELRELMDRVLGADAQAEPGTRLTIIPARLFADFSENGSVHSILNTCFEFAKEHNIDQLHFLDSSKERLFIKLLLKLEKTLKASNHLKTIKAFIASTFADRDTEKLRNTLQRHGAAVLSNPDVATHVIYPDPPGTREHQTDGQVLIRLLKRDVFEGEKECFVHWFFHPDSYDDWVPSDEVLGHVYTPTRRTKHDQWHLQARWVRDTETFNEWMNELDYEMPFGFKDFVGRPPLDVSCYPGPGGVSKVLLKLRISKERATSEREVDAFRMVGLPSIQNEEKSQDTPLWNAKREKARRQSFTSKSEQSGATSEEIVDEGNTENDGAQAAKLERSREQNTQPQRIALGNGLFLPSFAKWFDMTSVHEIEHRALPEFFCGKFASKTEQSYKEIRNFIIRTWRKNPAGYLSGTAARRYLSGDSCSILRVHTFLEHWGLINYACPEAAPPPSFNPPPRPLPVLDIDDKDVKTEIQMLLDDGGRAGLMDGKVLKYDRNSDLRLPSSGNFLLRDSDRGGQSVHIITRPNKGPVEYHCDSCKTDCSVLRFHCATKPDVDLCAACYQAGRYAADIKPRDFIQMNSTGGQQGAEDSDPNVWSESEILLLLEALEMFTDKWDRISEHVGSKTKSQCVIKFLQLPIEDAFLKKTTETWWSEHPSKAEQMPSPLEIMRKAGSTESSLAAITGKGSATRTHSGQPLVCADQISTIAPFIAILASKCPSDKIEVLLEALKFQEPQRRVRNPFTNVAQILMKRNGKPLSSTEEQPVSVTKQMAFTNTVYSSLASAIRTPDQVLHSEYGEYLKIATSALAGIVPVEGDELENLRFYNSPLNSITHQAPEYLENILFNPMEIDNIANGSDEAKSQSVLHGSVSEVPSSAIALTSLISACVVAAQWRNAEDLEVDRLLGLCTELRIAMIRLKMKYLNQIEDHEEFSRQARKRYMKCTVSEAIHMKKQRVDMETRAETDSIDEDELHKAVKPSRCDDPPVPHFGGWTKSKFGGGCKNIRTWSDASGFEAELMMLKLPDFSREEKLEDLSAKNEKPVATDASQDVSEEDGDENMGGTA